MNRDTQILEILEKIQLDLKKKYGLELSLDVIEYIVDNQFKSVIDAMEQKQDIKLNYLGRFIIKDGREDAINSNIELHKDKSLTSEEIIETLKIRGNNKRIEKKQFSTKIIINK